MPGNRYPSWYREDEDLYVYDQSCENCHNHGCPMNLRITEDERDDAAEFIAEFEAKEAAGEYPDEFDYGSSDYEEREDYLDAKSSVKKFDEVMQRRQEDAILRNGEPTWCIYWKGRNGGQNGGRR